MTVFAAPIPRLISEQPGRTHATGRVPHPCCRLVEGSGDWVLAEGSSEITIKGEKNLGALIRTNDKIARETNTLEVASAAKGLNNSSTVKIVLRDDLYENDCK